MKENVPSKAAIQTNLSKHELDLERLINEGIELSESISKDGENKSRNFRLEYQPWYTEAMAVIAQLVPDRLLDFQHYYKLDRRKEITCDTYTLNDYLLGLSVSRGGEELFSSVVTAKTKFTQQLTILISARRRFKSSLFNIKELLQAELFDSELDIAAELNKKGFSRAAGAVVGVVIEKHLKKVCESHKVSISKKDPTISYLNDELKNHEVYDIPQWRKIQHLGDLRNLCDHDKDREPSKDEISDLIGGASKLIKTIH